MLSESAYNQLKTLAEEVSAREGCRLYDLEFTGPSHNRILRVYIDAQDKSVDIDQCANVSRGLSLLLDVEDLIPGGRYDLEVSSPGLERVLRLPWHFSEAIGQKVKVKTVKNLLGDKKSKLKQVTGKLAGADEGKILVLDGDKEWEIEFENIHKAQVVYEFESNNDKKKRRGK